MYVLIQNFLNGVIVKNYLSYEFGIRVNKFFKR